MGIERRIRFHLLMAAAFLAPGSLIAKGMGFDSLAWGIMLVAISAWAFATVLFVTRKKEDNPDV